MSTTKFLNLLSTGTLHLTKVSNLRNDDPFEGSLGEDYFLYLKNVMEDDDFARLELGIPPGEEIPTELRRSFDVSNAAWVNDRTVERIYVNCWHISEFESAHLWSTYAASGEGVAIQGTVGKLLDVLSLYKKDLTIAPVRYVDYREYAVGPFVSDAIFLKRKSFSSEAELRIRYLLPFDKCIVDLEGKNVWNPPAGVKFNIDINNLFDNIYISPLSGVWVKETIEKTLTTFDVNKPVFRSSILEKKIL